MKALNIFGQSINFYGQVFNKVFWISLGSNLVPLILGGTIMGAGMASENPLLGLLGGIIAILSALFFYTWQISYIDQYASEQNDSLKDAIPRALNKMGPFFLLSLAIALLAVAIVLPIVIVASVFAPEGISQESLGLMLMPVIIVPVMLVMYRLIFSSYYVILKDKGVVDSIKLSNGHVKQHAWLVLRCLLLVIAITVAWLLLTSLIASMIALPEAALTFLEFSVNVLLTPLFGIFLYRLFMVTEPSNGDHIEEDTHDVEQDNTASKDE